MIVENLRNRIFEIKSDTEFNETALEIFQFQYAKNPVYQQYVNLNHVKIENVNHFTDIPFLPIEFFKFHKIIGRDLQPQKVFLSSGTSGSPTSRHFISDLRLYEKSFLNGFELFYGKPDQYLILALLPSYLERKDSSLVYMAEKLIRLSKNSGSGFYLDNYGDLIEKINQSSGQKIFLIGVTFALLHLADNLEIDLKNGIVMETGGMKGRKKEIIREELHRILCTKFHTDVIHSEYGMTELLSQAYSQGNGLFTTPPWMKILIRDTNDPKSLLGNGRTGCINVIDFANLYSCSFISTQDLGKTHWDGSFEVMGRFDTSDIRGCNLLM